MLKSKWPTHNSSYKIIFLCNCFVHFGSGITFFEMTEKSCISVRRSRWQITHVYVRYIQVFFQAEKPEGLTWDQFKIYKGLVSAQVTLNKMDQWSRDDKCVVLLLAQQSFVILRVALIPLRAISPEESWRAESELVLKIRSQIYPLW